MTRETFFIHCTVTQPKCTFVHLARRFLMFERRRYPVRNGADNLCEQSQQFTLLGNDH